MSEWVRWNDAKAIFSLLGEVRQLGSEPERWRRHLVQGLGSIIGAPVAIAGEATGQHVVDATRHRGTLDLGWATESDRASWLSACMRTEADLDPSDPAIVQLGRQTFTMPRRGLATDRTWQRSKMLNDHYRPAGLRDYLLSAVWIPSRGLSHFMMFLKPKGRDFTPREHDLVAFTQRELAEQWSAPVSHPLPPHLDRTLQLLERGLSEKEIAAQLTLSPHTVRDYCKALHRTFQVHSRGELLATTRAMVRPMRLSSELGG